MPDDRRNQIARLTFGELDRYTHQLTRCLKALDTTAPIRGYVQDELIAARAEQEARAGDPRRVHDASGLTAADLERARRELAASLALARPDSPARAPILAHMAAIDAVLAARADSSPGSQSA